MLIDIKDEGLHYLIATLNTHHEYLLRLECHGESAPKDIHREYIALKTMVNKLGLPIEFDKTAGKPMYPTISPYPDDGYCGMYVLKGGK